MAKSRQIEQKGHHNIFSRKGPVSYRYVAVRPKIRVLVIPNTASVKKKVGADLIVERLFIHLMNMRCDCNVSLADFEIEGICTVQALWMGFKLWYNKHSPILNTLSLIKIAVFAQLFRKSGLETLI